MDIMKQALSDPKQSSSQLLQRNAPPIKRSDEVIAMSALSSIGNVPCEDKDAMVKTYKFNIQGTEGDKNTPVEKSELANEPSISRYMKPPPSYPHQFTSQNVLYVYDGSKKVQNFERTEKQSIPSNTSLVSTKGKPPQNEKIKIMNSNGEIFEMNTMFPVSLKAVNPQGEVNTTTTTSCDSVVNQSESHTHIANQMIVSNQVILTGRPTSPIRDIFKCEECEYTSHNKHYLKQHVDLVHNPDRPYKCPFCEYAGKRSHSLREHMIVHSNERPYVCCHCNATFRKKGHLTNHEKLHQKTMNCPVCQVSLPSSVIEPHMRDLHKSKFKKLFICEVCSFIAIDSVSINKHLETHSKSEQNKQQVFVCSSCQTKCPDFDSFLVHAESHRNSLEGGNSVKVAENVSKNEKNSPASDRKVLIKCTECGYVVSDQKRMKSHMWKHIDTAMENKETEEAPVIHKGDNTSGQKEKSLYRCVECEFVCEEAYKFVVHMLSHKPELQDSGNKEEASKVIQSSENKEHSIAQQVEKSTGVNSQGREVTLDNTVMLSNDASLVSSQKVRNEIEKSSVGTATKVMIIKTDSTGQPAADSKTNVQNRANMQRILIGQPQAEGKRSLEIPAFVHDSQTARFRCTICGYTCEYQRTIKAHIWKHSGNKDIDYPMFQNGPLSIYDEAPFIKEEIISQAGMNMMPNAAVKVQIEKYLADKQSGVSKPGTELEKSKDIQTGKLKLQQPSAISPVAPVLASMLALRAKQKAAGSTCPEKGILEATNDMGDNKDNKSISQTAEVKSATEDEAAVLQITDISFTSMDFNSANDPQPSGKGLENVQISHVNSILKKTENLSATEDENVQEKVESLKRKSDDCMTDDDEIPQTAKRFCTSGASVVVEQVDSLSTVSTFTGIKNDSVCVSESDRNKAHGFCDSGTASGSRIMSPLSSSSGTVPISTSSTGSLPEVEFLKEKQSDIVQYVFCANSEDESQDSSEIEDSSDENRLEIDEPRQKKSRQRTTSASTTESAVTLLSLLQKGPNNNPACPVLPVENVNISMSSINEDTEEIKSEDSSTKKGGISSSLLAVIEQLRERSRENEVQEGDETTIPRKAAKRKVKQDSAEDIISLENMGNVEKIEEDKEVKYRCKLCHYSNSSTFIIRQHMRLHKEKKPFECSLCEFVATSSEDLQDHMIRHCKVRTYQCKLCSSAFNYKSQLRAHMRAHNDKDVFVCDDCDFESNNPVTFRNHVRGHTEKKLYKCEVCEKRFVSKYDLKAHKKGLCGKQKSFNCLTCDFVAIGTQEQKSHAKVHTKEFKCAKCDYVTTSITRFQNHAKIHEEPKALKCDLCDFPAVSSRSLKSHMKRHINDQRFVQQPLEQYKCNLCGYVCHHLPSLKSHMWRHASDTNYSYEFTNEVINAAIDYDCRLDTRECQESDVVEFYQTIRQKLKERLNKQEGSEDNERANQAVCWVTFRCCQCGFETINKADLNMHMKSHSDVIQWTLQVSQSDKSKA